MVKVIVNADDFGMNRNVNDAIKVCFEEKLLTNTTLMVNMPFAEEAVQLALTEGFHESVGIHLNLTSGMPLTDRIKKQKRFCRKDGTFNAFFQKHLRTRLFITKEESECVREEAEAQIRKYLSFGLPEKHLDSHHHVHTDLSVWKVLYPLLLKYDFRSVRLSRNLFKKTAPLNAVYKKYYNSLLFRSKLITTDYFGSYKDMKNMKSTIINGEVIELMLHPMYKDGVLVDTKTPMTEIKELLEEIDAQRQSYPALDSKERI